MDLHQHHQSKRGQQKLQALKNQIPKFQIQTRQLKRQLKMRLRQVLTQRIQSLEIHKTIWLHQNRHRLKSQQLKMAQRKQWQMKSWNYQVLPILLKKRPQLLMKEQLAKKFKKQVLKIQLQVTLTDSQLQKKTLQVKIQFQQKQQLLNVQSTLRSSALKLLQSKPW